MSKGTLPLPVVLGPKSVAWLQSEIDRWIRDRVAERDHRPPSAEPPDHPTRNYWRKHRRTARDAAAANGAEERQ
jgi:hypothetical protein